MTRILHVMPSLSQEYGGPIRAILDLSARARSCGLDSELAGVGEFRIQDNPMPRASIHALPSAFGGLYGYSPALRRWLDEHVRDYDGVVVHGMWLYPTWIAAKVCWRAHVPYACFPHGMLEPWSVAGQGGMKRLKKSCYWTLRERRVFERSAAVFFTTHREERLAGQTLGFSHARTLVVPYGASIPSDPVPEPDRQDLLESTDKPFALYLGRVHPKKNPELLIRAWALAKVGAGWRLIIAGPADPEYRSRLESLAKESGIEPSVRFVGHVWGKDKWYLLQRAQWFMLPSWQENFGNALLEAVGSGCAAAISGNVYLGDYIPREYEILDLELNTWVKFLRDRMRDRAWRDTVAAADRSSLLSRYANDDVCTGWTDVLRRTFSEGPTRTGAVTV